MQSASYCDQCCWKPTETTGMTGNGTCTGYTVFSHGAWSWVMLQG